MRFDSLRVASWVALMKHLSSLPIVSMLLAGCPRARHSIGTSWL